MRALRYTHLVVVASLLLVSFAASTASAICTNSTLLTSNDVVNIAVLVFLIGQPRGLFRGNLSDTKATNVLGYGTDVVQPCMLGFDLYVKKMRERGGMLPLPNGGSVKLNIVYINLAGAGPFMADYSLVLAQYNLPQFIAVSTFPIITPAAPLVVALYKKIVSKDPAVLMANWGITQPFSYIVPTALFTDVPTSYLANLVEDAQSAIIVHPYMSSREQFVCDGLPVNISLTPDCLSPAFKRGRRQGARRYKTVFSTLGETYQNFGASLEVMRTLGVKSIVLIHDDLSQFTYWLINNAVSTAAQLNIEVKYSYRLVSNTCDTTHTPGNVTAPNCPPQEQIEMGQTQTWPDGKLTSDVAAELLTFQADGILIAGSPKSAGSAQYGALFTAMRDVGYTPKAVAWAGGVDSWMPQWVDDPTVLGLTWSSRPFDSRLKGPQYHNVITQTQFELLPANDTHDGPAVFADAFDAAYGPSAPGGQHPFYIPNWQSASLPALCMDAMVIVQKMIESSMTLDIPSALVAATTLNTPSLFHTLAFNSYGQTTFENPPVVQKGVDPTKDEAMLIYPYNIATKPAEYPLPRWEERVFQPEWYSETNEKVLLAINTVCIGCSLILALLVVWNWKAPVIRAATPSFCLVIILGSVLMLLSNYFTTLVVNDTHCAVSTWLLTVGFQMVFSALFIKTFRIFKIFGRKNLTVLKMKDTDLLLAVAAFVVVDVIINAAWMASTGMKAHEVVVDSLRPKYNYLECDFSDGTGPIAVHLAIKGGILLFGIFLTYAVRNTPSQFNESNQIGVSIYNISFILAFIVPIIATGVGGRKTTYLIRAFAIMFASMSTLGLLYVPKLLNLASTGGARTPVTAVKTQEGNTTSPSPPKGVTVLSDTGGNFTDPELKSHADTPHDHRHAAATMNPISANWVSSDGDHRHHGRLASQISPKSKSYIARNASTTVRSTPLVNVPDHDEENQLGPESPENAVIKYAAPADTTSPDSPDGDPP